MVDDRQYSAIASGVVFNTPFTMRPCSVISAVTFTPLHSQRLRCGFLVPGEISSKKPELRLHRRIADNILANGVGTDRHLYVPLLMRHLYGYSENVRTQRDFLRRWISVIDQLGIPAGRFW